jgi:hypothetical protein
MHKCVNNSAANVSHLEQFVSDFFPYSQKQLGINKPVTIKFESDENNASTMLGKTAFYDPGNSEIILFIDGRHPKDVMRSLSHELVHHAQNCRGDFGENNNTVPGYAQQDPHLRKMEREAFTKGNLIFRDFEDLIKTGKIEVHIDFTKSGEPKMSLQEWKNNEVNTKLMKKWGLLKEARHAEKEPELEPKRAAGKDVEAKEAEELNEDSEGEETYHYGEDEGSDKKKEESLEDHLDAIEGHLKALRDDMSFDEEHERRHEKDTDFKEGMKYRDEAEPLQGAPRKMTREDPEWYGTSTDTKHVKKQVAGIGAARKKAHPQSRQESISHKISVREVKELARRVIERLNKEGK